MRSLVEELESRFEDRGAGEAVGRFLDFSVDWPDYHETRPVIVEAAQRHGLHCYDQHDGELHLPVLN